MTPLGKRLIQSAKEARKVVRGEADAKSYKMHIPTEVDVRAVRVRLKIRGPIRTDTCAGPGLGTGPLVTGQCSAGLPDSDGASAKGRRPRIGRSRRLKSGNCQ